MFVINLLIKKYSKDSKNLFIKMYVLSTQYKHAKCTTIVKIFIF